MTFELISNLSNVGKLIDPYAMVFLYDQIKASMYNFIQYIGCTSGDFSGAIGMCDKMAFTKV